MNLRNTTKTALLIALNSALAVACGADEGDLVDIPENSSTAHKEVLHSFDVAGAHLEISSFTGADGKEVVMISEEGSAYRQPIADSLLAEHKTLTSLEVYLALTQGESEIHEKLLAAHEMEAVAMGRDAAVRRVNFDAEAAIQKVSTAACTAVTFFPGVGGLGWLLDAYKNNVSGFTFNCLGGSGTCAVSTTDFTTSSVCNASDVAIQERNAYRFPGGAWQDTGFASLAVNSYRVWTMVAGAQRYYSADGNSAAGKLYHSRVGALGRL